MELSNIEIYCLTWSNGITIRHDYVMIYDRDAEKGFVAAGSIGVDNDYHIV